MSSWRERYKVHPAAAAFPMLDDADLEALGADIKLNGLKVPIVFWRAGDEQFLLVDGRNRFEAMERAGIELPLDRFGLPDKYRGACVCKVSSRKDPLPLIIALNVHRRHLTKEQRAQMLAAEYLANGGEVSVGGRGKVNEIKAKVVAKAAEQGISKRTVERAFEKATEHPNAPPRLRAKARRQRKRETLQHYHKLLATLPRTVEGARRFYLEVVARHVVDINAEMQAVVDGLQRIANQPAGERLLPERRRR